MGLLQTPESTIRSINVRLILLGAVMLAASPLLARKNNDAIVRTATTPSAKSKDSVRTRYYVSVPYILRHGLQASSRRGSEKDEATVSVAPSDCGGLKLRIPKKPRHAYA